MKPAIKIENLSKLYRLGLIGTGTLTHDLNRWFYRVRGKEDPYIKIGEEKGSNGSGEYVWALKDINLEVQQGEVLGIIGRNGAGKSTLLKILSKVTGPTTGSIEYYGRIGSLLEVGTGFHPELTGRENILLNGAILGMRKKEILRKLDEIIDFSGVERYIDTPVKRYSSGMYVRLAFSVAAHLEAEILIVDEVLAVGDAEFQKKCLGKMGDVAHEGRTVLFVSHNMAAVQQLTAKCALLSDGTLTDYGLTGIIIQKYQDVFFQSSQTTVDLTTWPRKYAEADERVRFQRAELHGCVSPLIRAEEKIPLKLTISSTIDCDNLRFSLTIFKYDGSPVGSLFSLPTGCIRKGETASYSMQLTGIHLAPGKYIMGIAVGMGDHLHGHKDFDVVMDVLPFEIAPPTGDSGTLSYWTAGWGSIQFPSQEITKLAVI